jgi:hypothetical protein
MRTVQNRRVGMLIVADELRSEFSQRSTAVTHIQTWSSSETDAFPLYT